MAWNATLPTGTSVTMKARAADTSANVPFATWQTVTNGQDISAFSGFDGATGRFIQYQATLATTDTTVTPTLDRLCQMRVVL